MLRKSYYLTLGVTRNESAAGIRQAFREIVKRYHPDRLGSGRLDYFQEIVEAYHVVAHPERRRHYDQSLSDAPLRPAAAAAPVSLQAESAAALPQRLPLLRCVYLEDARFEAALARVSESLTGARAGAKTYCDSLNALVILSREEAAQGGLIWLAVPSGSPCDQCAGSGQEGLFPCSRCDGEGWIEEKEKLRVHIPPMVGDGTVLEFPLRGLGVHGLYLRLNIRVGA